MQVACTLSSYFVTPSKGEENYKKKQEKPKKTNCFALVFLVFLGFSDEIKEKDSKCYHTYIRSLMMPSLRKRPSRVRRRRSASRASRWRSRWGWAAASRCWR